MNSRLPISCFALIMASLVAAIAAPASAQVATLNKGHQLMVDMGLQIWGCDTGGSGFNYNNLTGANMTGVMFSHEQSEAHLLTPGQKWGKWIQPDPGSSIYHSPSTSLTAAESARYADLLAIQVGDEQQNDLEDPNGYTRAWLDQARAGNHFNDKLLYINSAFINNDGSYATFLNTANPDAISFDAYPFGMPTFHPFNWLGKAQQFRRHGLGGYINPGGPAARPYGLYLQMYSSTSELTRDPGDMEMRWQLFTAWTLGYTFVDAFTVGGATSMFNGGNMSSPNQPRYNQFKESARQSLNLGPALTKLISYSNGPAGGGTSIVRGRNASGVLNDLPISWKDFNVNDAPAAQRYLTGVSAQNLGTKNGGQPGDVYVGFFNPLHSSFGNPAGTTYFMVTNALGAYLLDQNLLASEATQRITLDFNFGASGINSLQRLSRQTGEVEVVPLTHISGSQYRLLFDLEGGTGDLFKYNDGSPFVGIEQPTDFLYWDNDGNAVGNNAANGAGLGGTGSWDNASSKWFNGSTNGPWVAGKAAVLWGTAGTVTLAAPQSAESLQFKSNGYVVANSTLSMTGSQIAVDAGMTGTINSTLAGSVGINKTGAGTLVLGNASNSYTGGTTISAGAVRIGSDGNLGAVPGTFAAGNILLNGGTLRFANNLDLSGNRGITLGAAGGTIDTQSFTNPVGYNAPQGGFQGPGDLTKVGSGTFFAAATTGGANTTWTGRLIIKEGTWKIVASDGLPYNVPTGDGLKADQVTLDGGTWQIGNNINVTNGRRGITVTSNGGTIDTQSFDFTWAGPLAGSNTNAVLNKNGTGTLRFTGANSASTYNGHVNVNAGTLRLDTGAGGATMGSLATLNLADVAGATLQINGAQTIGSLAGGGSGGGNVSLSANLNTGGNHKSTTFAGVIFGSGSLTKSGNGTMTLTNANTYAGGTTISGGTLRVNNTMGSGTGTGAVNVNGGTLAGSGLIGSQVTVGAGGRLAPGASAGTLTVNNNVTLAAGSFLDYELDDATTLNGGINDLLTVNGNLTLGGALTLNIDAYAGDLVNGTYKLISYSGGLTGSTAGWTVGSSNSAGSHGYTFSTATPGEIRLIVSDATPIWTGAISNHWSTGGNWATNTEPNGAVDATLPTPVPGTGATIALSNGEIARSITFDDSYTLSGGELNLTAGNVTVASGKTVIIGSTLNGSAGLNKNGVGTLTLSGSNSYSGTTNINAGTLRVSNDGNLGGGGGITFGGGTLNATGSFSTSRAVNVGSGGGTVENAGAVTNTLTGAVSGAAANTLAKTGSGTFVLAQASPRSGVSSSWLGNVTVSGGTLKVGNGGSTGYLPGYDPIAYAGLPPVVPTIALAAGTTLEFNHAAGGATQDTAHAVVISGAGNVVISGAKPELFVANNTYTGTTTINSGSSLRIGWGGALNSGGLSATAISNSGALTFSNDHNTTFPGSISGAGTLTKEFSGTLTLTGAAAHTGGTTIAGGTLEVGSGGTTGSVAGNITNNGTLAFNRSDDITVSGVISGPGNVVKRGAGTLIVGAAQTYTGGTTILGGMLEAGSDNSLGAAPASFTAGNITLDGGTLSFRDDFSLSNNRGIALGSGGGTINTQSYSNPGGYTQANGIAGSGNLTKIGSGTFYMNTPAGQLNSGWTGNLILKEGTWSINERGGLPYNPPQTAGSPVIAEQITFDGGTLQIAATIPNVTNGRRGITIAAGGGTFDTQGFTFNWAGPLAGTSTSAVFTKMGSGTLQLNSNSVPAPSTYAGTLHVAQGTLVINGGTAMGDLAAVELADASGVQLTISGFTETIGSLAGGGAAGGNVTISSGLITGGNHNSTTFSGQIGGSGGLTKNGDGTLTLDRPAGNFYAGTTIINAGTLHVNNTTGSATGAGAVVVNPGGTLAGAGRVSGAVTINSGGHLAPGPSIESLDVGSLTLAAGAVLDFELSAVSGVYFSDLVNVNVNNGLSINGGTLNLVDSGGMTAGTYTLINYSGTLAGNVDNITIGNAPGGFEYDLVNNTSTTTVELVVTGSGLPGDHNADHVVDILDYVVWRIGSATENFYEDWRGNYGSANGSGTGQSDKLLTAVPEPASWLLMLAGSALLGVRRCGR